MAEKKITNTATKTTTKAKPVATPKATAQKAVAPSKKEPDISKNLPVEKGMSTDVFSKEILTELTKRSKEITSCLNKIDSSFEKIAFDLYWIYSKQAYKANGFDSIYAYCGEYFGYSKTTCYSFISVVERFAKRDENGVFLEKLDERVKGYSVSKLSLMIGLTDEQLARLKPEMSVRDIKKFVKSLAGKALPELPDGNGKTKEDTEEDAGENDTGENNDDGIIDTTAKEIKTHVVCVFEDLLDIEETLAKDDFRQSLTSLIADNPNAVLKLVLEV